MIPSLHSGVSALKSLTQGLQVLGNNISNVNSLGYKSSRANYSDNFYQHINDAEAGGDGQPSSNVLSHGTGCLLYTSPSPRDRQKSRMPSSA